jgi:hypothetical protein
MTSIRTREEKHDYTVPLILAGICLLGGGAAPNCWPSGVVGIMLIVAALFA